MKRKNRILAAICTTAMLTGIISMPTSALAVLEDGQPKVGEPMAETLYRLTNMEGSYTYDNGDAIEIFNNNAFYRFILTKLKYEIVVEDGTVLPEDTLQKLSGFLVKRKEGRTDGPDMVVSDVATQEDGFDYPSYFVETSKNHYTFSANPYWFAIDKAELTAFLQTISGFVSVSENIVGYDFAGLEMNLIENYQDGEFIRWDGKLGVVLTGNEAPQVSDFPVDLNITSFSEPVQSLFGRHEYWCEVQLDESAYDGTVTSGELSRLMRGISESEQVDKVEMPYSIRETNVDPTDSLIDNGAMTYVTRGDCDQTSDITIQDAFLALQDNSNVSAGSEATLSGADAEAADVDGDGEITIDDAFHILQYNSMQSAGLDASWTEILK